MSNKILDLVNQNIVPVIGNMGYEVVETEYIKKLDKEMHLVIYIYNEKGISLDDCEKVNNAIEAPLDALDPTEGKPYVLDVSSPGLDRVFKNERDFIRNAGKEIEVNLYAPANFFPDDKKSKGSKNYEGVLTGLIDNNVVFKGFDGRDYSIPFKSVAAVRQLIKFH